MSLYFVRHQHTPETCPAKEPAMGKALLGHMDRGSARGLGVEVLAEAVLDGQHTFVLIVEAAERRTVEAFMEPFAHAGSVVIMPASTCEAVVERQGCAPVATG